MKLLKEFNSSLNKYILNFSEKYMNGFFLIETLSVFAVYCITN